MWQPLFFSLVFISLHSQAASWAVPFYRSPQSLFPSGEMSISNLEKAQIREEAKQLYLVQKGQKRQWVASQIIARDEDLEKDEALTLIPTLLRSQPDWQAEGLMTLPSLTKVKVLEIKDTWAYIQYTSITSRFGYIDLNNVVLKYDFAAYASGLDRVWKTVKYREGADLVLEDEKRLAIKEILNTSPRLDLGIAIRTGKDSPFMLREHVQLIKSDGERWRVSKVQGHGDVYWKKDESQLAKKENSTHITSDELLSREIYSIAFHPQNPKIALASAQGIFLTKDGKVWQNISHFQNQNHPVLISNNGDLFVGSQRSLDQGKNFSPYLRWDQLTQLLHKEAKTLPHIMKITDLSSPRPGTIRVSLDLGNKKLSLMARNQTVIDGWEIY